MKVIFYRHLPTKNNLNNVFIGRLDIECDAEFIQKNRTLIDETMRKYSFAHYYSSPLKRARQSAEIFFPNKVHVFDRRLIERDLGDWKNVPKCIIKEKHPTAFFPNGILDFSFTPPHGEPFEAVLRRVASFLLDLNDNHDEGDNIAVITHNGIITAVKCLLAQTTSTERIEFQPFLQEFVLEMTPLFLDYIETIFSASLSTRAESSAVSFPQRT